MSPENPSPHYHQSYVEALAFFDIARVQAGAAMVTAKLMLAYALYLPDPLRDQIEMDFVEAKKMFDTITIYMEETDMITGNRYPQTKP